MSRPRIRTVKPETWQDEKIGDLSRDARLLFIGLVTMADDEGRLRARPSLVLGHVFPYDDDAPRKLSAWLGELDEAGLILSYEEGGKPYIAFRHWRRHQKINRATPSLHPAPPDPVVVRENSVREQGDDTEDSVRDHGDGRERSQPPVRTPADRPDQGSGSDQGSERKPPQPPASGGASNPGLLGKGKRPNSRAHGTNPRALAAVELATANAVRLSPVQSGDQALLERLHEQLREAVPEGTYGVWLADVAVFGRDGDTLILDAPPEARSWLGERFTRVFEACAAAVPVSVRLRTDNDVIDQGAAA